MNMQKQQQLSCSYLEKLDFYRINVETDMVRDLSSRNVGWPAQEMFQLLILEGEKER